MQVDLSVVKGYRTYILMGANIICVGLESLGVIPEGTWVKITAVLVSLGIVTNRAGSKNDAAAVSEALAAFPQSSPTVTPVPLVTEKEDTGPEDAQDPIGDIMATVEQIISAYKASQARMERLGKVISGITGVIEPPVQEVSVPSTAKGSAPGGGSETVRTSGEGG